MEFSINNSKMFLPNGNESAGFPLVPSERSERYREKQKPNAGISGTKIKNRKQFLKMMHDAERGIFDIVAVKDFFRVGRTRDFVIILYNSTYNLSTEAEGDNYMWDYMIQRILMSAEYIFDTGATVRDCAKHFNTSKSTVHTIVTC